MHLVRPYVHLASSDECGLTVDKLNHLLKGWEATVKFLHQRKYPAVRYHAYTLRQPACGEPSVILMVQCNVK